jgi:cytidyltransferase-like protein
VNVVYTAGTFDLLHVGHVRLLNACRKIAGPSGKVIVALNTDSFIREYKGEYPVIGFGARKELLLALRCVDYVIEGSGQNSKPSIEAAWNEILARSTGLSCRPYVREEMSKYIVIGSDWAQKDYFAQMQFTQQWLDEQGIQLVYVPYTFGISTSQLRRHLCD